MFVNQSRWTKAGKNYVYSLSIKVFYKPMIKNGSQLDKNRHFPVLNPHDTLTQIGDRDIDISEKYKKINISP